MLYLGLKEDTIKEDYSDIEKIFLEDSLVGEYVSKRVWEVKENSNMGFSLQGLNFFISSNVVRDFWLDKIYGSRVAEAHRSGKIHVHTSQQLSCYCMGWDLYDFLRYGIQSTDKTRIVSAPPKHFSSALNQLMNLFFILQGESAGAQAVASFDTLLAPFIRYDLLTREQVKQELQSFIYNLNEGMRTGGQAPFTNITLDIKADQSPYANMRVIIGGEEQEELYKDFQWEINLFNEVLFEVFLEGDANGRIFTFPIPTINITENFDWDNPALENMWKATAKYGIPYFSNFISTGRSPDEVRSMCCRLSLSLKELREKGGGLFGANPLTGCYDEETEILTSEGWKRFKEVRDDELVYTLSEDNKIELQRITRKFEYDWDGDLIHFKSKSIDLLVTPNHKMVVDTINGVRKLVEAKDFSIGSHRIPKGGNWKGKSEEFVIIPAATTTYEHWNGYKNVKVKRVHDELKIPTTWFFKFFGIWLGDGSLYKQRHGGYQIFISQKKEKYKDEIRETLANLSISFSENEYGFYIYSKPLYLFLEEFGKHNEKYIPNWMFEYDVKYLRELFRGMMIADGYIRNSEKSMVYYTTSKRLADDFQRLCLLIGYNTTMREREPRDTIMKDGRAVMGKKKQYEISVHFSKHIRMHNEPTYEYYKGKVYCVEVPKYHTLFVRRNGKVTWSGNSINVYTINMPRIAYEAKGKGKEEFVRLLIERMEICKEAAEKKRRVIEYLMDLGLYPYSKFYLDGIKKTKGKYFANHFSTIGLVGMNEACEIFLGKNLVDEEAIDFAEEIMEIMRKKLVEFQEETGNLYNLEATPAESVSYRLPLLDRNIGLNYDYYTNATHLPVDYTNDPIEYVEKQWRLERLYTGGTVIHFYFGEKIDNIEAIKNFIRSIFTRYPIPYISITPTFSVCPNCGYIAGEHHTCSRCGSMTEVYSRVVGYYRPVSNWNLGKQKEYKDRKVFKL